MYLRHSKKSYLLIILLTVTLALLLLTPGFAFQANEKVVERGNLIYKDTPVKVTEIKIGQKTVKFNSKFEADNTWLKGVTFKLKNISDKEITHIRASLRFPETESAGSSLSYSIYLGHIPGINNGSRAELSLLPGQKLDIALNDQEYQKISSFVGQRRSVSEINKATFTIEFVIFSDGTAYGVGNTYYQQDPNKPGRYIPVPATHNPEGGN